jgi:hypothetical protein
MALDTTVEGANTWLPVFVVSSGGDFYSALSVTFGPDISGFGSVGLDNTFLISFRNIHFQQLNSFTLFNLT